MGETGYWKGETSRCGNGCDIANLLIKTYWSRKRRMKSKDKIQENNMAIRNGLLKKLCGSPELLTFKTVKWRYRDKREDYIGTHSQKWQSTKTDQTIPSVQALQYNNITVSKNHFLHFKRYNITVSKNRTTDLQISLFLQFCVSRRYSYSITVLKNKKNIASNYNAWTC